MTLSISISFRGIFILVSIASFGVSIQSAIFKGNTDAGIGAEYKGYSKNVENINFGLDKLKFFIL